MSYKTILEMPANELVAVLKIPALMVRTIPKKSQEYGSVVWSYFPGSETPIFNKTISTCLTELDNPEEFLLVGNRGVKKSEPDPIYAAFKNKLLLEAEKDVLELVNKCYNAFREGDNELSNKQTKLYLGKTNEQREILKTILSEN